MTQHNAHPLAWPASSASMNQARGFLPADDAPTNPQWLVYPEPPQAQSERPLPLIVHSHLRWGPGAERPRQVFSRLAIHHPVLFIEPPMYGAMDEAAIQCSEPHPNVCRAIPLLPLTLRGGEDVCRAATAVLLGAWLNGESSTHVRRDSTALSSGPGPSTRFADRFEGAVQWFCSPLDSPAFIGRFGTRGAVYDRAGALAHPQRSVSAFSERDRSLIRQAQLVFYGTDATAVSRLPRPRLHARSASCRSALTSSVDASIARARRAAWDGLAETMRARMLSRFAPDSRRTLSPEFLAASAMSFGVH